MCDIVLYQRLQCYYIVTAGIIKCNLESSQENGKKGEETEWERSERKIVACAIKNG